MGNKRENKVKRRDYSKGIRGELIQLTLACGCLPYRRLALLRKNTKTVQKKIREMQEEGVLEVYHEKGVWVVGLKEFSKKSPEYANAVEPKLIRYYERFGATDYKKARFAKSWESLRVIRNIESYMFMHGAGLDCMLGSKTSLRAKEGEIRNAFYSSREIKAYDGYHADLDNDKLLRTTRVNGLTVSDGGVYPIYNMGDSLLTYNRSGEKKIEVYLNKAMVVKGLPKIKGSIILANNNKVFNEIILPKTRRINEQLANMEGVYEHVYGLTLDEEGQKMMQIMKTPNWDQQIYSAMLQPEWRTGITGTVDCDGQNGDVYYFCYCVPDIKRLKMFLRRAELENNKEKYRIYCFDTQAELIVNVVGKYAKVSSTPFERYYNYVMKSNKE